MNAISAISAKLGLSRETVGSAAAAMLPDVVDTLSEHGDLGTGIPDKLMGWLGNMLEELGHFGAVATGAGVHEAGDAAGGMGTHHASDATHDTARASGFGKLLPWLRIGALLIGAFLFFRG